MNPYVRAVISALISGTLGALVTAQVPQASTKIIITAFGIPFLKSLQDIFTPSPAGKDAPTP